MKHGSRVLPALGVGVASLLAMSIGGLAQQAPPAAPAAPGTQAQAGRGGRGGAGPTLFGLVDSNKDGAVTRDEFKASFDKLYTQFDASGAGSVTQDQVLAGLNTASQQLAPQGGGRGAAAQNQTPNPADVQAMMAALPDKAPATPRQPRKVLVLGKAAGFVHSSIPLAARTVEELGKKTGAWSTTITYDPADINAQNLKQYDAVFLDSTTGAFLDDPNDQAATDARRKALLEFVRGGKGLAGIHAATDSYHRREAAAQTGANPAAGFAGRGGGRGGAGAALAPAMFAQGDSNADQKLSRAELTALADVWFDKIDADKAGSVKQADFVTRFTAVVPPPAPPAQAAAAAPRPAQTGPDGQVGTWPEFNKMIGGFFKFHWLDPQEITYKIDDPKSPLTAMFKGAPLVVHDETYTFGTDTYSRENLHILTSIDYSKMTDADKAKEDWPRPDHDYALSWIKRDGNGRVFYIAHGHHERNYAVKPLLEHLLAGMQYALGDLKADDSPSVKPGTGSKTAAKK
jgi:type 1 glutamine amidotransferase